MQRLSLSSVLPLLLCVCIAGMAAPSRAQAASNAGRAISLRLRTATRLKTRVATRRQYVDRRLASLPADVRAARPETIAVAGAGTFREQMLALINEERQKVALPPLTLQPLLNATAQQYAEDMDRRGFFSHTDPEGRQPVDRIRQSGYLVISCSGCRWQEWTGENIAKGQATPRDVMADWMASPAHRDNILSAHYSEVGIGHAGAYWVQEFGDVSTSGR